MGDVFRSNGWLAVRMGLGLALSSAASSAQSSEEWREPVHDAPEPEPEPEPAREARGASLRNEIPDIEVRPLPPFSWGLGITAFYPFQVAGLGLEIESYPPGGLRVGATYSFGLAQGMDEELIVNNYAELVLGLLLLDAPSERMVQVLRPESKQSPSVGRPWGKPHPSLDVELRAWLPSSHLVFVEAGLFTGYLHLERCLANCGGDAEDDVLEAAGNQLFYPFGGLRYLYFVHATSQRWPDVSRKLLIQIYAHAIVKPLNEHASGLDASGLQWSDGRTIQRQTLGLRMGFEIPLCLRGCASMTIDGGYLPSPGAPMISVGVKARL